MNHIVQAFITLQRHHKGFGHRNVDVKADSVVTVIIRKPEELDCDKSRWCSRKRGRWEGLLTDEESRLEVETERGCIVVRNLMSTDPRREKVSGANKDPSLLPDTNTTVLLHLHAPPP